MALSKILLVLCILTLTIACGLEKEIENLQHTNPKIRYKSVVKLGKRGDRRAVKPLIATLLSDKEKRVQEAAVEALGRIGDQRAIRPLLTHGSSTSLAAVERICQSDISYLINALNDDDYTVRGYAADLLGKIGDERAIMHLINVLDKPLVSDEEVEKSLNIKLDQIRDEKVKQLIENERDFLGSVALMFHPEKNYRLKAAIALKRIGGGKAIQRLTIALNDSDLGIRKVASKKVGWDITKRVLLESIQNGNKRSKKNSVYTFIKLGNEEILPELIETLERHGNKEIAETYLNCGHRKLKEAAQKWATLRGYKIKEISGPSSKLKWGY